MKKLSIFVYCFFSAFIVSAALAASEILSIFVYCFVFLVWGVLAPLLVTFNFCLLFQEKIAWQVSRHINGCFQFLFIVSQDIRITITQRTVPLLSIFVYCFNQFFLNTTPFGGREHFQFLFIVSEQV